MRNNRGFSLIEILLVMAISIILVGLVLYPVFQSFWMTRQAQAMIDAQDTARLGMEQISRELGEAMFVFDNSVVPVDIYDATGSEVYHDGEARGPILLPVRQVDDSIEWFTLVSGKIDFILPKITMHCDNPSHPAGEPRDYPRRNQGEDQEEAWPPCPVCTREGLDATDVSAKPKMPLEQGSTVVRYFLGLRYNDPQYNPAGAVLSDLPDGEGLFGWRSPWVGEVEQGAENQVILYRVEFDPHDDTLFPAGMSVSERLADPMFFYRAGTCKKWMQIARVIGIGKYQDLVVGMFDPASGDCTDVEPSVTFKFQAVNNDTFAGAWSNDRNFEYPNAVPAVYTASQGYWIDNHVSRSTPAGELDDASLYNWAVTIYRNDNTICYYTRLNSSGELVVQKRTGPPWSDPPDTTFNITQYIEDGVIPSGTEMAFVPDLNKGQVKFGLSPPVVPGTPSGFVCSLSGAAINEAYRERFATDRGSARRSATLLQTPIAAVSLPNARIVPGSDRVVGPDMFSGAGPMVRYERVPLALGNPGLNQYKIDYDTGDIQFSSDYAQDVPSGNILVDYRIQFNRQGDIIKGDYTTKSLVTVHMAIRMFDPESGNPHVIDVTNSVKVRNAHR